MKKLIAGFVLVFMAAPAAQAWTGGIEDMRAMEANQRGPVVRIKSHTVSTCRCHARCKPVVHRGQQCRLRPHNAPGAHQVVQRAVAPPPPSTHIAQRVVSEKIYVQNVKRYPAKVCPTAR
ncbi:MAG: hypothetical protein PHE17_00075 [Thiothrix sp.]|uniref:hypothetical protein n=1 Tax=Thiothrix sp. TaxID=1032 RepID=UPI002619D4D0|nr:hypothetical protein [Thiothrix sp.]MDD5391387.1 hypothetical protein [Thiothrix sp.]